MKGRFEQLWRGKGTGAKQEETLQIPIPEEWDEAAEERPIQDGPTKNQVSMKKDESEEKKQEDKGIKKLIELKERFGGMLTSMSGMMGQQNG